MRSEIAALLGALTCLASACGSSAPEPVLGVRLGMTPAQVRERFAPGVEGTYRSEAMGEDFALVWEPASDEGVREARHEFHLGQLVALRLTVAEESDVASGDAMQLTDVSLLTREPTEDGVRITWLARSCPTHADEVRRRIRDHR